MISNYCVLYFIIIIIVNSIFCSRDHFSIIAKNFCEADLLYFQIILGVQVLSNSEARDRKGLGHDMLPP